MRFGKFIAALNKRFWAEAFLTLKDGAGRARPSPLRQIYAEWRAAKADLRDMLGALPRQMSEDAEEKAAPLYDRIDELEDEILSIPAASAVDLAVKVVVAIEATEDDINSQPSTYIGRLHREALGMIVRAG